MRQVVDNPTRIAKISVVTVCFNSQATIADTIQSVLGQDFPDIEYIIVDGGSNDGTLGIINENFHGIALLISEPDGGIYDAMNKGIKAATGDAICMLNSDDVYTSKSAVRKMAEQMSQQGTDTVFADLVYVDKHDMSQIVRHYSSKKFKPSQLKYGWMPAHPTFLCRRRVYQKWGGYSLDFRIASDFEMMVRLFHRARVSYAYLPDVLVKMRVGGISTSGLRNSWALNREILRACRSHGLRTNSFLLLLKIPAKLFETFRRR